MAYLIDQCRTGETCGKEDEYERLKKAGPIARRKAMDMPDMEFAITSWHHKHIGFIQYLKCKLHKHDAYFW